MNKTAEQIADEVLDKLASIQGWKDWGHRWAAKYDTAHQKDYKIRMRKLEKEMAGAKTDQHKSSLQKTMERLKSKIHA